MDLVPSAVWYRDCGGSKSAVREGRPVHMMMRCLFCFIYFVLFRKRIADSSVVHISPPPHCGLIDHNESRPVPCNLDDIHILQRQRLWCVNGGDRKEISTLQITHMTIFIHYVSKRSQYVQLEPSVLYHTCFVSYHQSYSWLLNRNVSLRHGLCDRAQTQEVARKP